METTIPQPSPICVACVGDGADPVTGATCLRCKGSGTDPDPDAPRGILVVVAS